MHIFIKNQMKLCQLLLIQWHQRNALLCIMLTAMWNSCNRIRKSTTSMLKAFYCSKLIPLRLTFIRPKALKWDECLSEWEKTNILSERKRSRDRKNGCYLHRWNGCVGGCTCECRLLGAMSGKRVLSGKRRAALVRQSTPRPTERQSRTHGFSFLWTCRMTVPGVQVECGSWRLAAEWKSVD